MKRNTLLTLTASSLMLILAAVPSRAQDRITATIPFSFDVVGKTFPAGDYDVESRQPGVIQIRNANGKNSAFVLATWAEANTPLENAKLIFHRYDRFYFLSEVWAPESGHVLGKTKLERELKRRLEESAANQPVGQLIYLAARVK
jgi:hypothetical protein